MTWKTIPITHWGRLGRQVWVRCPRCKQLGQLGHDVGDSGKVTPSLVCPDDTCTYHEHVTLEDWPDGGKLKVF